VLQFVVLLHSQEYVVSHLVSNHEEIRSLPLVGTHQEMLDQEQQLKTFQSHCHVQSRCAVHKETHGVFHSKSCVAK
jgi:hypothetical protein